MAEALWKKAIENRLDETDIKLLNLLVEDNGFTASEIEKISKNTGIEASEVEGRVKTLKNKGVILKYRISLINMIKIWDFNFITFLKAKLQAPLTGVLKKHLVVWSEMIPSLKKAEKKLGAKIIRQAFSMHGTKWDVLLMSSVNEHQDLLKFTSDLIEQGWIESSWTMKPSEYMDSWIFDPVAVPSVAEYEKNVHSQIYGKEYGRVWRKAILMKLNKKDVKILNALVENMPFAEEDIEEISNKLGIGKEEVLKRLEVLRNKKILLKDRISLIDLIKVWDFYLIVLIKAKLYPPVIGTEVKDLKNEKGIISSLEFLEKKVDKNLIRQAFTLHGTDWNLLLIASVNNYEELDDFLHPLVKQGLIEEIWVMRSLETDESWVFDPIGVPTPKEYNERVKKPIGEFKDYDSIG